MSDDKYIAFGEHVAHKRLNQQCQYASRYIDGRIEGYPNLGEGLRFKGETSDYHSILIHEDDVDEFVRRVEEYKENRWE